ncbi:MAG: RNase H family protein [Planctomycetota bacterium]
MTIPAPHFLLFSEARSTRAEASTASDQSGLWHFVLESVDGSSKIEATDQEAEVDAERLELLAIVRGLEALDQPSNVTLVTRSRSVTRGLRFGIDRWRENGWQWECFGKMAPIKDSDLWQRVDHALRFHEVRCRTWRFDPPEEAAPMPKDLARRQQSRRAEPDRRRSRFAAIASRLNMCFRAIRTMAFQGRRYFGDTPDRRPWKAIVR